MSPTKSEILIIKEHIRRELHNTLADVSLDLWHQTQEAHSEPNTQIGQLNPVQNNEPNTQIVQLNAVQNKEKAELIKLNPQLQQCLLMPLFEQIDYNGYIMDDIVTKLMDRLTVGTSLKLSTKSHVDVTDMEIISTIKSSIRKSIQSGMTHIRDTADYKHMQSSTWRIKHCSPEIWTRHEWQRGGAVHWMQLVDHVTNNLVDNVLMQRIVTDGFNWMIILVPAFIVILLIICFLLYSILLSSADIPTKTDKED